MSTRQAECSGNGVTLEDVIECESEIIARGRAVFDGKGAEPQFLFGLALSGGGIRSATFNLGLIQALAECRILARLDYLSTVSGGGYIGSWFSALLHRRAQRLADASQSAPVPAAQQDAPHGSLLSWFARFLGWSIEKQAAPPTPSPQCVRTALEDIECEIHSKAKGGRPRPEPRSLEWLRRYSNYLTPRFSLFSLDTWGAIANLFRNLVLNQVILVSLMVALLLVPLLLASTIEYWTISFPNLIAASPPLILTLLGIAAVATARGLQSLEMDGEPQSRRARVGLMVVLPLFLASLLVAAVVALASIKPVLEGQSLAWSGYGALVYPLIWGCAWRLASRSRPLGGKHATRSGQSKSPSTKLATVIGFVLSPAGAGAALGLMLFGYANVVVKIHDDHALWLSLSVGSMVVLQILCLAVGVQIGLGKRCFSEAAREWLGRAGGLVFAVEFGWAALALIAFYGPALVAWLNDWAIGGGAAWIGSTVAGLLLARSSKTGGARPVAWAEHFVRVVPYIFIVGLGIVLAGTIHWGMTSYAEIAPDCPRQTTAMGEPHACGARSELAAVQGLFNVRFRDAGSDGKVYAINAKVADDVSGVAYATATVNEGRKVPASLLAVALLVFVALGGLFALRVDVNLFSMHQFYRNRLARCYLGASRHDGDRHANAFTDLDPHDDIPLSYLADQRPIHLINAALNLTHVCDAEDAIRAHEPEAAVHLAWQQRLSSSFVFSPHFCGFAFPNDARRTRSFRPTADFMVWEEAGKEKPGGADLGMAMAVSGAAANPNQGYHTSPALAFLMTFFNVRLGRWCGNPNSSSYEYSSPVLGLRYLLKELFGYTDEKSEFLNLSDGGHFENLGLYELVRRRCKLIIASDASCDPKLEFEDLGNAIRKCRVDLGVEIKLDVAEMKAKKPEKRSRIAIGTIDYGAHGGGILIYLKPLRRGNESIDVRNYADTHKGFPHQATADQWFDEAQFESYRQLGLQSGRTLARNCGLVGRKGRSAQCDDWVAGVVATLKARVEANFGASHDNQS